MMRRHKRHKARRTEPGRCPIPCTCYIHPQGRSGWRPGVLSRGRRSNAPVVLLAARIPNIVVHVPRTHSASGDRLPRDRARPSGLRIHRSSRRTKISLFLRPIGATINAFTQALKIERYAIYVFDYGAPTGFRLAMAHPDRVTAIVSQNGNAYEEGLGDAWGPIRKYWAEPTAENRDVLRQSILTAGGTRWQYTHGVANPESVPPESYTLDTALLERPGNKDIQLDLFLDYASNVKLYPKFQEYFRKSKPPLLAIWGKNDPFFIPAGAEAFRKDIPSAKVQFLDTGHFAIETHVVEIASAMKDVPASKRHFAPKRRKHGLANEFVSSELHDRIGTWSVGRRVLLGATSFCRCDDKGSR